MVVTCPAVHACAQAEQLPEEFVIESDGTILDPGVLAFAQRTSSARWASPGAARASLKPH